MLKVFVTLGAVVALVLADEKAKFCDDLQVMENLDITKLKGLWWEWAGSGTISFLRPHSCHASNFYPSADGKAITALNDYVSIMKNPRGVYTEEHVKYSWKIADEDPAYNGKLVAQIETYYNGGVKTVPFLVLDTDYDKYLVVYMCLDGFHFLTKFKSALLLTRKSSWSEDDLKEIDTKVEAALAKNGKTRVDLGLVHGDTLVKNCSIPTFPDTPPSTPGASVSSSNEAAPPGYAAAPAGFAAQPTGFAASKPGYADTPAGFAAQTTGYANQNQPTGFATQPTGYATRPTGSVASSPGYGAPPTGSAAAPPTGFAASSPGYATPFTGFAAPSTGYAAAAPTGYAAAAPTGYAATPAYSNTVGDDVGGNGYIPIKQYNNNYGSQSAASAARPTLASAPASAPAPAPAPALAPAPAPAPLASRIPRRFPRFY